MTSSRSRPPISRLALVGTAFAFVLCSGAQLAYTQQGNSEKAADSNVVRNTGDAMLRLPIDTPLGTAQFQPNLTLRYSSSGGDGPFGIGWRLSLGSIQRTTRFGAPSYLDTGAGADRFEFEGKVLAPNPADPTEYRLRTESFATHTTQERRTSDGGHPCSWLRRSGSF